MAATAQLVIDLAPELASTPTLRIEQFIDIAELQVNEDCWGDLSDIGVAYLAAHLLSVSAQGGSGPAGPVTGETVGSVSRSYASPPTSGAQGSSLGGTPHGREFLRLQALLGASPQVL